MRFVLAFSLIATLPPAAPRADECPAGQREPVAVAFVSDRLDLRLADGRLIYFPTLEPPRASSAEPDRPKKTAAQALALLQGAPLFLQPLGAADRWGRLPARLFLTGQDETVDEILIGAGLAMRGADAAACAQNARRAEASARAAGVGIWSDPAFAALAADQTENFADRDGVLTLVEGRIISFGHAAARLYLNFGGFGGFYATIAKRNQQSFARAGFSESRLRNRKLRLRGIVELPRGPHMELFHPEQIEFMDEAPGAHASGSRF